MRDTTYVTGSSSPDAQKLAEGATSASEPLLTVPELATWLRIRPKTIYAWAASGRLPCVRLGGRLRFARGDVLRWLEARKEA